MDADRPEPLQVGATFLQKYEVKALLGKGGYAYVYECLEPFLNRTVAIKVIRAAREHGRDLTKRARAEARVLAHLTHENLVQLYDAGIADGLIYLVMEKLDGRTLRDVLRDLRCLTPIETLHIAFQVAAGMQAAHREDIIHRDLKPENIFILPGNRVKVLDFGIAKFLGYQTTQKDVLQGTVLYMSPEHLQGTGVTARSDVFALGTILYECLYCHPLAVRGLPPTLQQAAWAQMSSLPPLLSDMDPSIPPELANFVQRAIVKLPEQRYAGMADLREAARQVLQRLAESARRSGSVLRLRDLSCASGTEAAPGREQRGWEQLRATTLRVSRPSFADDSAPDAALAQAAIEGALDRRSENEERRSTSPDTFMITVPGLTAANGASRRGPSAADSIALAPTRTRPVIAKANRSGTVPPVSGSLDGAVISKLSSLNWSAAALGAAFGIAFVLALKLTEKFSIRNAASADPISVLQTSASAELPPLPPSLPEASVRLPATAHALESAASSGPAAAPAPAAAPPRAAPVTTAPRARTVTPKKAAAGPRKAPQETQIEWPNFIDDDEPTPPAQPKTGGSKQPVRQTIF
jgi:serine/threonine-protein kinase